MNFGKKSQCINVTEHVRQVLLGSEKYEALQIRGERPHCEKNLIPKISEGRNYKKNLIMWKKTFEVLIQNLKLYFVTLLHLQKHIWLAYNTKILQQNKCKITRNITWLWL